MVLLEGRRCGKQGGIHESIGIIFGVGPLLGGYFSQLWPFEERRSNVDKFDNGNYQ